MAATKQVQIVGEFPKPDWLETDETSIAFIKNKPASLPAQGGDADTANGHAVQSDVPKDAKFTDTTYSVDEGLSLSEDNKISIDEAVVFIWDCGTSTETV